MMHQVTAKSLSMSAIASFVEVSQSPLIHLSNSVTAMGACLDEASQLPPIICGVEGAPSERP